jgi:flavin-dependent dehydrogenase
MRGLDVVMVDRAGFPSDTLSTHAIARGGMVQLLRWGLIDEIVASGAPPIREVAFHVDGDSIVRQLKDRHGVDFLLAPRRQVLDRLLQEAPIDAGVDFRPNVTIDAVTTDEHGRATGVRGRCGGVPIEVDARMVVGADGLRSRVARSVGAQLLESRPADGATHYAYVHSPSHTIEYHAGDRGFAGVFPTHGDEACVWVCTSASLSRHWRRRTGDTSAAWLGMLTAVAPFLAERIADDPPAGPARGMIGMPNQFRDPAGPGWVLVGDAGYHRDAITGHGISDAFRDAELAADAVSSALLGSVDEVEAGVHYRETRERLARPIFELSCAMSELPGRERLIDLLRQLAVAIDDHAGELAGRTERSPALT